MTARQADGAARGDRVPPPLEDYAFLSDTQTGALVSRDGSIDWLCLPRFDSPAMFAALLGTPEQGHWQIRPASPTARVRRRYRGDSLVLETEFTTADGVVRVVDFMPVRGVAPDVVRIVEGVQGRVRMQMQLRLRFDYGHIVPWVRRVHGALYAVAGPDSVWLRTPVALRGENFATFADFTVAQGDRVPFVATWQPSHLPEPTPVDPFVALNDTETWWADWLAPLTYAGQWREPVVRSLVTLKGLTYAPTGGMVAAPTTSLPERLGGVRNWDYRFCWLRDATVSLQAFLYAGMLEEARAWREWLLRAVAGDPADLQIMYGVAGERRLPEWSPGWLPGYQGAAPVRVGNAASGQFQLDVYGEVMDALHQARRLGLEPEDSAWALQRTLMEFLEGHWADPDNGLWEVRSQRAHFTHSKLMAWVAADRGVKSVEQLGLPGPGSRWRALRDRIRADILMHGYDDARGAFTQSYGSDRLDAALLMVPMVGFLPSSDPRVRGTVAAIERELMVDGLVHRYRASDASADGMPPGEAAFLACSFWLADNYLLAGRRGEAVELFERVLALRNDVGLLAEEYDTAAGRLVGNFPQAFSHVPLVVTALNLDERHPSEERADGAERNR